jgi:formate dehydrogenase major subunit
VVERKKLVWWDEAEEQWVGDDVPDFPVDKRPTTAPTPDAKGMARSAAPTRSSCSPTAAAAVRAVRAHGRPAAHALRAARVAVEQPAVSRPALQPGALRWTRADNVYIDPQDERYPCVLTTFRLTEHHTAGPMSRYLPWLAELQPEMFVEIDPVLARERGIEDGGFCTVRTARATSRRARWSPRA